MSESSPPPNIPSLNSQQIDEIIDLGKTAGFEIMRIYRGLTFDVFEKKDLSPVTEADLASNRILLSGLSKITPHIPIISEESDANRASKSETYWLVDPLDGTRDFVAKLNTFVICMGLIHDHYPVAGFIHEPVTGKTWWAQQGMGAFADGKRISNTSSRKTLVAAGSRSTPSLKMVDLYREFSIGEIRRYGSALKFCHLSEGEVDLYPRFGPTSEWDTAAGQAIAEEAGCKVISLATGGRLAYGKPDLLNAGGFAATRADLTIGETVGARLKT